MTEILLSISQLMLMNCSLQPNIYPVRFHVEFAAQSILLGCNPTSERELPTTERVRQMAVGSTGNVFSHAALVSYGVTVFPAFEVILTDPKSETLEIVGVLSVIADMEAPKRQFLALGAPYLSHKESDIRIAAIGLVREVGTQEEASILIALLSDKDKTVACQAVSALSLIGGRREVIALDVWLRTGTAHRDDRNILDYVKKCRDDLEKRVKENPLPKGIKN